MFSAAEADLIIGLAEEAGFEDAGLVRGRQNESIRVTKTVWLDENGPGAWVFERVVQTVLNANRAHFGFALTEFAERVQIARYDAEAGGHFDWHSDIGAGTFAARRKLTLVAQLSEPLGYEGGVLELNGSGREEPCGTGRGDAILFPSFVLHRVTPLSSGRRYSLTTWIHGPDFV